MARSKQFNYFTDNKNPEKKRKEIFKKILKWLKIVFYILIFGLTLTGCVQSFTVKTSGTVGNGTEFYKSKNDIAPRVSTFISNNQKIKVSDKEDENIDLDVLSLTNDVNFHVNEKQFKVSLIEQLMKQTTDNGGDYGKYDTFNSSIRVIGNSQVANANKEILDRLNENKLISNDENQLDKQLPFIISKDGKYLFKQQDTKKYTRLYNTETIKFLPTLPTKDAPYSAIFEFENDKEKKPLLDNGKYNVSFRIKDLPSTVDNYDGSNSENVDEKVWANVQYANDVLQFLYKYSFGEGSKLYNEINKGKTEKITVAKWIDNVFENADVKNYFKYVKFGDYKLADDALTQIEAIKAKTQELKDAYKKTDKPDADKVSFEGTINKYIENIERVAKVNALVSLLKTDKSFNFEKKDELITEAENLIKKVNEAKVDLNILTMDNLVEKLNAFDTAQGSNIADVVAKYLTIIEKLKVKMDRQTVEILQKYNDTMAVYLLATSYNLSYNKSKKVTISNIKNLDAVNSLILRGDVSQRAITSWGEAWEFGPFFGLLVFPLARLMQSIRQSMPDLSGWASIISLIIAIVLTRLLSLAITFKSTMTQSVQEDLKVKKAAIEAKYKGFEDNKTMKMRKQQEISSLYSKYNLNPLDSFGSMLISIPIFLAMWRVIQGLPEIKATVWLGINFSTTSWQSLLQGNWAYLWVIVVAVVVQLLSQLLPQLLNRKKLRQRTTIAEVEALKKSERTQRIMLIVFTVITIIFTAGVQLYWIFGGLWTIGQVLALHKIKQTKWFKYKYSVKAFKK